MINFLFKRNTIIIIVIAIILVLLFSLIGLFSRDSPNVIENDKPLIKNYVEKIDNFTIQEFTKDNKVLNLVQAKQYLKFEDSPNLLVDLTLSAYNDKSKLVYKIFTKSASYDKNKNLILKDSVDIVFNNDIKHNIQAEELIFKTKKQELISNKKTIYQGGNIQIISQGMELKNKTKQIKLIGKTIINQNNDKKLITNDLYIDQVKGQKHYYSNKDTTYLSEQLQIYSKGLDIKENDKIIQLLGEVKIYQDKGITIDTKNLIIESSEDGDIVKTKEKVNYQSKEIKISSKGMNFNLKNKKLNLTGGVKGVYE
jgi:LPS export ABC transporter protein LptC